ncbi:regulator of G protein signaling superfamily [Rhizoclosmatium globosum]|uniref:Regulator of G protein signaling superfamily n=1 Tax=Rhizoclosmatium globosum TaxID=329046 RepID=A0A1Y2BPB8_9FUNG|nr:regulator of G protein signaling superfamily [Rhizoclosmatium globosum]|eukprot:ORY36427.1 regulator of G protein signaling superfamily [Rhizoclosmatium globosum]
MVTPSQLKIGLVQVLDDQLPSPLSCREFHDFLLQEHSEENIEFYFALRDYKAICAKYPDDILRNKESEVNSAQSEVTTNDSTAVMPASSLSRSAYDLTPVEEAVTSLLNTFFLNDPPREVNVPAKILKPMFHAIQVEKNMHPEVFNASLDTILTMMRLSSFPNFYKIAAAKTDDAESNSSVTPILLSPQGNHTTDFTVS